MDQFFVYIIYSESRDRYYVGSCDELDKRISDHNAGRSKYTKSGKPWVLKYHESFQTRSEARKREIEIKKKNSRKQEVHQFLDMISKLLCPGTLREKASQIGWHSLFYQSTLRALLNL